MKLTKEEQEMLDGKYGDAVQMSMELLVAVGDAYDAEYMVPIGSAHLVAANPVSAGKGGKAFIKEMAEKGGKFIVPATTNPTCMDPWLWKEMGFSEQIYQEQVALSEDLNKMGGLLCCTCTPYLIGHTPRLREHVAWGESSAVLYVNAVLGARTNREGGPSALAAAITGKIPAYGYHLDENRYGDLKVINNAALKCDTDYSTLGYFVGRVAQDRVPIITGIPSSISQDAIKYLGTPFSVTGSVSHYHIVGVTPEALTEEMASGYKRIRSSDTVQFGPRELRETEESLSAISPEAADLVVLGCPHASITQLKKYAESLSGRKIKNDKEMWVLTNSTIKKYAQDTGIAESIESTGARLLCNTCPPAMPRDYLKHRGYGGLATDSPKMVYYVSTIQNLPCYYGNLETCLDIVARKI